MNLTFPSVPGRFDGALNGEHSLFKPTLTKSLFLKGLLGNGLTMPNNLLTVLLALWGSQWYISS